MSVETLYKPLSNDTDGRDNSLFIDSLYFAQLKLLLQFYKYFQAKPLFRYWILEIDNEKKKTRRKEEKKRNFYKFDCQAFHSATPQA